MEREKKSVEHRQHNHTHTHTKYANKAHVKSINRRKKKHWHIEQVENELIFSPTGACMRVCRMTRINILSFTIKQWQRLPFLLHFNNGMSINFVSMSLLNHLTVVPSNDWWAFKQTVTHYCKRSIQSVNLNWTSHFKPSQTYMKLYAVREQTLRIKNRIRINSKESNFITVIEFTSIVKYPWTKINESAINSFPPPPEKKIHSAIPYIIYSARKCHSCSYQKKEYVENFYTGSECSFSSVWLRY